MEETEKTTSTSCSKCQTPLITNSVFCDHCGYPENGTEDDLKKYKKNLIKWTRRLEEAKGKIQNAKITLFILAGICILVGGGLLTFGGNNSFDMGLGAIIIGVIYAGLGVWTSYNPVGALVTALIVYGTLMLLSIFENPANIISGIIWKVLIISALVKGLMSAREGKQIMEELPPKRRTWN